MTTQTDFTDEEWHSVLEGPTSAGMMVITAERGGTFRETYSMAKAYAEARQQHGSSELLDAVVGHKPETDHTHFHSNDELKAAALAHIRDAIAALQRKATPAEVEEYRTFVLTLATKVAEAHKEHGNAEAIGSAEQAAIDEISAALATPAG
jgi:hypothetical protein